MSYWIYLHGPDEQPVDVERFTEGGTYSIGGTTQAELNVTYNYARHFDYRALDGRRANTTIIELATAVQQLGTERDPDYWASTPGNAGYACKILLDWALEHPDAIWRVN